MRTGARITPCSKALSTPPMVGGVDFRLTIILMVGSVLFTIGLKILYVPLFGLLLYFVLKQVNKDDPMMVNVLRSYSLQGSFYEPFTQYVMRRNDRPNGFGRGNL